MKLLIFLAVASVAVMLVMVGQVVRQEISKNSLRVSARDAATEILRKERAIVDMRNVVRGIKPKLLSMTQLTEELKTKKDALQTEKTTLQDNISTCNKEKDEAAKANAEATENLKKQKSEHNQAKETAQTTIQNLKQSNLDHEKAICALVDATNAEARKLCGLPDTPQ